MASKTVGDIIGGIRAMHHQLAEYYRSVGDATDRQRVQMLLRYLSRHEEYLETALGRYQEQASRGVLKTWIKNTPDHTLIESLDKVAITKDMTADEVTRVVLEADQRLVSVFRQLAEGSVAEDVKDLFQRLLLLEEREERRLVRDSREMEDV